MSTSTSTETGAPAINSLQKITSSRIDVGGSGRSVSFDALAEVSGTVFVVDAAMADLSRIERFNRASLTLQNGGTADLTNVIDVDGSSFYVKDGVTLELPSVTHYDGDSTGK